MNAQEARLALRDWIIQRGNVTDEELRDDSSLVSDGIINSLDIFELIAHMEHLRGRPLDLQNLNGDEFRSVDKLVGSFFVDAA